MYRANPLLRERNELKGTTNRLADLNGAGMTKDRPETDLFNTIVTSTAEYMKSNLSLAITLGGVLEKMSDHRKRWNERFLMYEPEARVFRYRRPEDPVDAWRDEHWYVVYSRTTLLSIITHSNRTQQVRRKVERMPRPNNSGGTSCDGTFGGIDTIG